MKKETAVEWLLQRFEDGDMYNVEDVQFIKHQALVMEKEQIVNAFNEGNQSDWNNEIADGGEQYYNETYNNND